MTTAAPIEVNPEKMIAVMLYPEREKPPKSGPYRFPTSKVEAKGAKTEMAMNGQFLNAGPNFVTTEAYEQMRTNPGWARCVSKKIIEIIEQQPTSVATGTSADFDLADAFTMIETAVDEDWLKRCLAKDDRKETQKLVTEKIQELKDEAAKE